LIVGMHHQFSARIIDQAQGADGRAHHLGGHLHHEVEHLIEIERRGHGFADPGQRG
jgi:hypothetical protein